MGAKNYLTFEEMGISFGEPVSNDIPDSYNKSVIDTYLTKVSSPVVSPMADAMTNKHSCMCDALKAKAEEAQPVLPMGTNEIINRIINKLYDLAKDIELTSQGY